MRQSSWDVWALTDCCQRPLLPLCLAPQDIATVVQPLDATSWAEVLLAVQIENLRGAVVLLRLALKRRKLPHYSFDSMSKTPRYLRVTRKLAMTKSYKMATDLCFSQS